MDKTFKNYKIDKKNTNDNRIAILATEFYDKGGHTQWALNIIKAISDCYAIRIFLLNKATSYSYAPLKMSEIENYASVFGVDINNEDDKTYKEKLITLLKELNNYSPKVLFSFIHMNDFFGNGLLYLVKKHTDIKIIHFNHASHLPILGCLFFDAMTSSLPISTYIDYKFRGVHKSIQLNLGSDFLKDIQYLSKEERINIRHKLGISDNEYFTLSGASAHKFFDKNSSPYFEMIKKLLHRENKLVHVVMSEFNNKQQLIIKKIFENDSCKKRLKIIGFSNEYAKIFQSCDLFLDSFPIGSALTHIELMKYKKVSVIKINEKNSLFSFQEYFPSNYPYSFEKIEDFENGVIKLLKNPNQIKKYENILYQYFLKKYEGGVVKQQCINIINNVDDLSKLYIQLDNKANYNLEDIQ